MKSQHPKNLTLLRYAAAASISFLCFFAGHAPAQETVDDPESAAIILFNKGQDAHEAGELKAAIRFYEQALKIMPDFPEAELQRGNALQSVGDLDAAEAAFRRAVSLREDWSLAIANLGALMVRRGKFPEARPLLKRAIELDKGNTPAHVAMAALLVKTAAPAAELKEIHKNIADMASAAKPAASLWYAKAILENALGDTKAAAESSARSLEIDPKNISSLAMAASLSLDAADPDRADISIAKIESIDSSAQELLVLKAGSLNARGKTAEALAYIDGLKDPPAEVAELRTRIASAISDDTAALEKRLDTEPKNTAILGRLCSVLRAKEPSRAMDYCRRAFELEPTNIEHAIGYGAAMLQAKNYAGAVLLFQKLHSAAPDNFTLRANFATALFQLKRYNEAKVQYQWIVEKQPENVPAYFFLAVSHDQLGEYADAAANYQIFLRKADPKANQLEIDKINLRLPVLQRQLDSGKGRKNAKTKG